MIRSPFRNLSIRNKLILAQLFVVLGMAGAIYQVTQKNDQKENVSILVDKVEDIRIKSQQKNQTVQDFLLKERLTENFLQTGSAVSLELFNSLTKKIEDNLSLLNRSELANHPATSEHLLLTTQFIQKYNDLFLKEVDSIKQISSGDAGLKGTLNNYTTELQTSKLISPEVLKLIKEREIAFLTKKDEKAADELITILGNAMKMYTTSPSAVLILGQYKKSFEQILSLEKKLADSSQINNIGIELAEQYKKADEQIKTTIESIRNLYEASQKNADQSFVETILIILATGVFLQLIFIILITKPIRRVNNAINAIADEGFEEEIDDSVIDDSRSDEAGSIANNFNSAVRKLKLDALKLKTKTLQLNQTRETLKRTHLQKDQFISIVGTEMHSSLVKLIQYLERNKYNFKNFSIDEINSISANLNEQLKQVDEMIEGLSGWAKTITEEMDKAELVDGSNKRPTE